MSSVAIVLDTRPPVLSIAAADIEAGQPWVVTVTTDEALSDLDMTLTDVSGAIHPLGWTLIDPRTAVAVVGTDTLPPGSLTITAVGRDMACNASTARLAVLVMGEAPIDVTLGVDGSLQTGLVVDHTSEITVTLGSSLVTQTTIDRAFEPTVVITGVLDAKVGIEDG